MNREIIEKFIGRAIKLLFMCLIMLMFVSVMDIEGSKKSPKEQAEFIEKQKDMRRAMTTGVRVKTNNNLPDVWPPKMNSAYPEIELFDQDGKGFLLSSLKGRVLIVEYIDISSPLSQAQSGAAKRGAYYGSASKEVDKYALPFADILRNNTNGVVSLPNNNIVELKVIIYGENGAAGSRDDAANWATHFGLKVSNNVIVAVPKQDMRGEESQSIISGFQLVDRNMLLRVDSSGTMPKHNLKMTLVPLVPKLMRY